MNENVAEEVNKFSYFGSVVTNSGGAAEGVRIQIQNANAALLKFNEHGRLGNIYCNKVENEYHLHQRNALVY
jgi:hypothetical protein